MIEKKMEELILGGELLEAKKLVPSFDYQTLRKLLMKIARDEESISAYSFILMMLCEKETAQYHRIAVEVLVHAFASVEGAYKSAMYHLTKSVELDDAIDLDATLSFLDSLPDKFLTQEEAKKIVMEVVDKKKKGRLSTEHADK